MSAIDLSDLEAKARAATLECPGEWCAEFTVREPEITHHVVDDIGEILATPSAIRDSIGDAAYGAAAAFIAAASPSTVLALIAVARAAGALQRARSNVAPSAYWEAEEAFRATLAALEST